MPSDSTDPPEARYKPGLYSASAPGFRGDIKVSVSFPEDGIIGIAIDEHNETVERGRVAFAIKNIPENRVQKQSREVDAVAGAAFTSLAIIKAVGDCVKKAGGGL
jgi:fumarate reductase flavoprotein subunit